MGLYDIIDEIANKQITKGENGDPRIYGVVLGQVAKNYDQAMPGRVCVTVPVRDDKANELKWARVAMPSSGTSWGHYFLPEVGDQVLLAFEGGNIEKPYVMGCIPKDGNTFLKKSVNQNNQIKRIVTKNGSTVRFDDVEVKESPGTKDKITVSTANQSHTILMDNENNLIRITDKEKTNMIEMKTQEGAMVIKMQSKITIQVGETIKLILNGESGALKIEANDVKIEATQAASVSTDGMLKLEGAQLGASGSSSFKAESSGAVEIAGSVIKIG